jgi:hypothetical protein
MPEEENRGVLMATAILAAIGLILLAIIESKADVPESPSEPIVTWVTTVPESVEIGLCKDGLVRWRQK